MTETKFTPGPWCVYDGSKGLLSGNENDFNPIDGCGCCGSPWINGEDGGIYNAHLIAAAPDLFKALCYAGELLEYGGFDMEPIEMALAKARGEVYR